MVSQIVEEQITEFLFAQFTKKDKELEVARLIFTNDIFPDPNTIQFWAIRENIRQITEKTLELEDFPEITINLTFVSPKFFLDVFEDGEVAYWQISTVKRVLSGCKIIYDPQNFIAGLMEKIEDIKWNPEVIKLKKDVSNNLIEKAKKFIEEDMLADAYFWAVKASEEAICAQLMINNSFNVTTPSLLLDSLRSDPILMRFYLEILGIDNLSPDMALVGLKELENLAEYLYHKSKGTPREQWILTSFVSINEAERKLLRVIKHAADENLDLLDWESLFEDAVAELWQAFFISAQTPWKKDVPIDPWMVSLFWKWHVSDSPQYSVHEILDRCTQILKNGSPLLDWERN